MKPGFKKEYPVKIGSTEIKILPINLFLATKWEAFKNRGNDPRTSHDFEDIIYLIDNNVEVVQSIKDAENDVKLFLKEMSSEILNHPSRNEIIECHINPFSVEERRGIVLEKFRNMLA